MSVLAPSLTLTTGKISHVASTMWFRRLINGLSKRMLLVLTSRLIVLSRKATVRGATVSWVGLTPSLRDL